MPNGLEITQRAIEDFTKVQENMMLAKEEPISLGNNLFIKNNINI